MTAELDKANAELRKKFAAEIARGDITHIGTFGGCRRKNHRPDAPYSEHAWPGGNASDVHVRTNAVGDRVAAWMRSRPDLWSEVFWEIALHWDHVHGTANPRKNFDNKQIPPCAGGATPPTPIEEEYMFSRQGESGPVQEYWIRTVNWIGQQRNKAYNLSGSVHDTKLSAAVKDLVNGDGSIMAREMLNLNLIMAEEQAKNFAGGGSGEDQVARQEAAKANAKADNANARLSKYNLN